jgi:HD-like signal output (HDOD) protein
VSLEKERLKTGRRSFDESFVTLSRSKRANLLLMSHNANCFTADHILPEIIARAMRYPPSAQRVLPLLKHHLEQTDYSIYQIIDLIRLDPGISARVMQLGNSRSYARQHHLCSTIELAVQRIGLDLIYEIVVNAVAEQVLVQPLTAYALEADELWNLSVSCAFAAEFIAETRGEDTRIAYTLGLLHGIGMVAIDQWLHRHQPTMGFFAKAFPWEYSESEHVLIGCTNAEVGAELLRGWDFPFEISEPLRCQYNPLESLEHLQMSSLLYAAKWVRSRVCFDDHRRPEAPEESRLVPIDLNFFALENLALQVRARLDQVKRELALGDAPQPFAA